MQPSLSEQMHVAATQLAATIEAGELDALSVEQRFHLRWLALGLVAWSDLVETLEAEAMPVRTVTPWWRRCLRQLRARS